MSFSRKSRAVLLLASAALVVGIGCVAIPVPADKDTTAEKVYLPKAEGGDPVAQLQLALAYRFGTAGVARDDKEAWRWLNKSAISGNSEASMMVAEALWRGDLGQAKQPEEALARMRALAERGSRDQQAHLASLLEGDLGGEPRYGEAAHWFEKAARRGHRYAAQRLGRCYEIGRGVKADRAQAWAWYQIAAAESDLMRLKPLLSTAELSRAESHLVRLQGEIAR